MKRIISALALVTMASLAAAGCGGDDDDNANTGGSSGSANNGGEPSTNGGEPSSNAGTPSTNGGSANGGTTNNEAGATGTPGGASSEGGASSGNVMCDPTQNGTCQNDMDCPFVVDGSARMTAGTCGQGCVASQDKNCSRDCILKKLKMSSGCATCYADTVNCTIKNCLGQCIADPEAAACKQCQVDKGCRASFDKCSGLPG